MMLRILDRLEEILIAILIAAATLIIFVAVAQRYSLGAAASLIGWSREIGSEWLFAAAKATFLAIKSVRLTWAQELCIYLFIWMAKFGAAYGVRTGIHVGVDVLVNRLKPGLRHKVVLFGLASGALFTGVVGTLGATFVWEIARTDQTSADLELPMWLVYLAVPFGSYLMCFRFLRVAWAFLRTGELPHHDAAQVAGLKDPHDVTYLSREDDLHPRDIPPREGKETSR